MKVLSILAATAIAAGALFSMVQTASAQATRTWVSGVGDDVNPCSRTAPCKTFAGAISKTAAGGEINCLDPGGFGTVTIIKSITLDCTGTLGSVLAPTTTGVILNGASIDVILRGLTINGGSPNVPGVNGVRFLQGASLLVDNCMIFNFRGAVPNGHGILVNNTSGTAKLTVTNSTIANNGTAAGGGGVAIEPTGTGAANVVVSNSRLVSNHIGLRANANGTTGILNVAVSDTTSTGNLFHGFAALASTGFSRMNLARVVSSNNGHQGLRTVGANSVIHFGDSMITGNALAFAEETSGRVRSYGNNQIQSNINDGPALTVIPLR